MKNNKIMNYIRNNGFIVVLIIVIVVNLLLGSGPMGNPLTDLKAWIISMLVIIPGIVIGITVHEFAHAFVAYKLGDQTPKYQKRVTLNPFRHIDPIGLIALFLVGFGWGKPVQVNPYAFKHPRRDNLLTDIAGVVTNFIVAFIFAGFLYIFWLNSQSLLNSGISLEVMDYSFTILSQIVWFNLVLMIFNLLPVPPLDGFGIVTEIFNLRGTRAYETVYRMGFPILIVLIIFQIPSKVIGPIVTALYNFVVGVFFGAI